MSKEKKVMGVNEKKEIDNIQTQANGFPFKWAEKMMDQMEKEQKKNIAQYCQDLIQETINKNQALL